MIDKAERDQRLLISHTLNVIPASKESLHIHPATQLSWVKVKFKVRNNAKVLPKYEAARRARHCNSRSTQLKEINKGKINVVDNKNAILSDSIHFLTLLLWRVVGGLSWGERQETSWTGWITDTHWWATSGNQLTYSNCMSLDWKEVQGDHPGSFLVWGDHYSTTNGWHFWQVCKCFPYTE